MAQRTIYERETGQLQVSIATSLALEGALGIYPEREETPAPILQYTRVWINVSTLVRNLFNALPANDQDTVGDADLVAVLLSELPTIQGQLAEYVGDKISVTFYRNHYEPLLKTWKRANRKHANTPKQQTYAALSNATLMQLPELIDGFDYREFQGRLNGDGRALLLTHQPLDLLSWSTFEQLTLLESHTGRLKAKPTWGSKLGVKNETLPFNAFTLQVFGDGSNLLSPMPIKYRRAVLHLAKQYRWNPTTTLAKIKMDLTAIKDPDQRQGLIDLYNDTSF